MRRMMASIPRVGLALVGLAVVVFAVRGLAGRPVPPAPARVVTVGVYENPPKVYTDRRGEAAGIFIDLLREIAAREHWSLRFVHCTWAQCLQDTAAGRIEVMPDVAFSTDRQRQFEFPDVAAAHSWSQVYRRPGIRILSIADLRGRRIAVLRNGIQQQYLQQLMAGSGLAYTPVLVDSYADGFAAVREGRADAVVSNSFFGGANAAGYGLVETSVMFEPVGLYYVTGKGRDTAALDRIDAYLLRWREDPQSPYFSILRRAMAPPPVTVVPRWLVVALYAAGASAALLFGFSLLLRWRVRRATAALAQVNHRLDQVLSASPVVLYLLRRDGPGFVADWVSPNIERLFGFSAAAALAPGWWQRQLHPDDRAAAIANQSRLLAEGHQVQEFRVIDAWGRTRHVHDESRVVPASAGAPLQVVGTWSDLTETRAQAAQVEYLTNFDALTGLANRAQIGQRLAEAIARAKPTASQLAVLCIDLDRFKIINETLGPMHGDELLRQAAGKLQALVGPDDHLARVGGDRFVLLLGADPSQRRAIEVAQQVVSAFARPSLVGAHEIIVTASVGVGMFPGDGEDADTLLMHAELALYEAKQRGRGTYRLFAPELATGALERLVMESALRGAASRGELVLHYQPQIDLRSGRLVGVEALVRWQYPPLGLVPPGQFIPLAEETGIINDIAAWVLEEACRQMMAWRQSGFAVPCVAVNLSTKQMEREALSAQVANVLARTGLPAACLELEITESTIMREPDQAISVLQGLKAQGVMLSIDDFGTGHSSLSYLKRLPLDRLKIDQSFVREIGRDSHDEAISRAVIELARSLGLETVAEGVEREEQAQFLRAEGCEFAQGYLFSRPLPAAELRAAWSGADVAPIGAHGNDGGRPS